MKNFRNCKFLDRIRQKRREYDNISEAFNTDCGKIYILKPSLALVVKAILRKILNDFNAEVEVGLTPYKTDKLKA